MAGIHLAVCIPLVLAEEWSIWDSIPQQEAQQLEPPPAPSPEDGDVVSFSPCGMWEVMSVPRRILGSVELPAIALSGWRMCATFSWTPAGLAGAGPFRHSRAIEEQASIGFCAIVVILWFLVGSFPLRRIQPWYQEPGALITGCFLIWAAIFLIGGVPWLMLQAHRHAPYPWTLPGGLVFAGLPSLLAMFAWLWWFGLLLLSPFCLLRRKKQ